MEAGSRTVRIPRVSRRGIIMVVTSQLQDSQTSKLGLYQRWGLFVKHKLKLFVLDLSDWAKREPVRSMVGPPTRPGCSVSTALPPPALNTGLRDTLLGPDSGSLMTESCWDRKPLRTSCGMNT